MREKMKKLILLILPLLLLLATCGGEEKTEGTSGTEQLKESATVIEEVESPDEPVTLAYKFEKGDRIKYRFTSSTRQREAVITDSVQQQALTEKRVHLVDLEVIDVDADGITEFEVGFEFVEIDLDANGEKLSYKTGTNMNSQEASRFVEYNAIVNNHFRTRISPLGEVVDLYRVDKVMNEILMTTGLIDSLNAQQKTMLQSDLVEGMLKPLIGQLFRKLPEQQVAADSSWSYTQPPMDMQLFQIFNTHHFTLTGFEDSQFGLLAVMTAGLTSESDISEVARQNKIDLKEADWSGNGRMKFSLEKGCFAYSSTKTEFDVRLESEFPTQAGGTQIVARTQNLETDNLVELLSFD